MLAGVFKGLTAIFNASAASLKSYSCEKSRRQVTPTKCECKRTYLSAAFLFTNVATHVDRWSCSGQCVSSSSFQILSSLSKHKFSEKQQKSQETPELYLVKFVLTSIAFRIAEIVVGGVDNTLVGVFQVVVRVHQSLLLLRVGRLFSQLFHLSSVSKTRQSNERSIDE
jgi:hypothetical protein